MKKIYCLFTVLFIFSWWVRSSAQIVFKNNAAIVTKIHEGMWVIEKATDHTTMYLIEGAEKAMLVDAGNPVEQFDSIIKLITQKPLYVMITHGHGDHTGNIPYYNEIYLHPCDTPLLANKGYKGKVNFLNDRDVFDLGGKKIEVRHMPGHTLGSVVFLDKKTGDSFSGDTFGSGHVWLWITPVSTMQDYLTSCKKMKVIMDKEGIKKLFVGHSGNTNVFDKVYISNMITLAQSLIDGTPSVAPQEVIIGIKKHLKATLGNATIVYDPEQLVQGKNLFILSGQSNMQGLHPEESFTPAIEVAFGKENIIVVKDAWGGQPIWRWYKQWKPLVGNEPTATGDLYDSLMNKVNSAIINEKIKTVTFIWMQGERDAKEKFGDVYKVSLVGLYDQLSHDLKRKDINFVIGRISDFDMANEKYPQWTMVREIQVEVAKSNPRFDWVDSDDLNDGVNRNGKEIRNDLHMSANGYIILGDRFANSAIRLIKKTK
jgi:glyoxylase-like metal-dependent hydrolase (beta-lactamase superfamily II)